MSDLLYRLRLSASEAFTLHSSYYRKDCQDAADEIERLQDELNAARREERERCALMVLKGTSVEWFTSETNGVPMKIKGETEFMRVGEFQDALQRMADSIMAMEDT